MSTRPIATPETKAPCLASVYALSKYDQERMCLLIGRAYGIPTVALRFFNVYGPRQALSNPYKGVLAIFASRLLNHQPPIIYEDGLQQRDFVSVHDVARACRLAVETRDLGETVLNVGSGQRFTVRAVAERIARALGRVPIAAQISGRDRAGDIRHCFADIARYLGFMVKHFPAQRHGATVYDLWNMARHNMFTAARESRGTGQNDLFPFWITSDGVAKIERHVPALPHSRDIPCREHLRRSLVLYRMVFGQNRQEDLVRFLLEQIPQDRIDEIIEQCRLSLAPATVARND